MHGKMNPCHVDIQNTVLRRQGSLSYQHCSVLCHGTSLVLKAYSL